MRGFKGRQPGIHRDGLSIEIRVVSGCCHREYSPYAYALIDTNHVNISSDVQFVEHESGPELLAYAAMVTAGLTLAKSVIDRITVTITARGEGINKGDRAADPLELIVRQVEDGRQFRDFRSNSASKSCIFSESKKIFSRNVVKLAPLPSFS